MGRAGDFVASSISRLAAAVEQAVFSEELARLAGLLQQTDPRAKVVVILLLVAVAGLVRHLPVVAAVYALALLLAWLSRLPLAMFVARVWLGVPLFAGLVALPALFLVPGRPVLLILEMPPLYLAITDNGLGTTLLLVARVGTSVSLAVLLVLTTRWADLLRGLRMLHVPQAFIVVLGMTYRYIFLLLRSANNLFLATASRTVGETTGADQRRRVAGIAGALVSRSVKLSGDVHLAMRARGFAGETRTAADSRMRDEDRLLVALGAVAAAALLLVDGRIP